MKGSKTNLQLSKTQIFMHQQCCAFRFKRLVEKVYPKYHNSYQLLTKRELEILKYMALGTESQIIAEKLSISKHTVQTHRKNIHRKTELKTPRDLVLFTLIFDIQL
ncbi:helix-turn-helix transcriptional regulator [Aggregatimonas sangjinii]|uniref:Helix-turn-helix transcriptional regulator n=1 Tax=Aggregatimonas sangjinii TaxID=2583587 RepID=A0A5B7SS78_9FLAO|nr:helix-turn-helix transcriptional regulator [Aggregatimonas sangjinii]QCX01635.1 helix-turn-helix transcriptional regulator [Aggregatimonas sangjinii]